MMLTKSRTESEVRDALSLVFELAEEQQLRNTVDLAERQSQLAAAKDVEYVTVLRFMDRQGLLETVVRAHRTPVDQIHAVTLVRSLCPDTTRVLFGRNVCGRARERKHNEFTISLPKYPGSSYGCLRLGLVLHEIAHVRVKLAGKSWGHGPAFCNEFARLLKA